MSGPHIKQDDRDAIEDRGLIEDDNTEEMRTAPAITGARTPSEGRSNPPITRKAVHP